MREGHTSVSHVGHCHAGRISHPPNPDPSPNPNTNPKTNPNLIRIANPNPHPTTRHFLRVHAAVEHGRRLRAVQRSTRVVFRHRRGGHPPHERPARVHASRRLQRQAGMMRGKRPLRSPRFGLLLRLCGRRIVPARTVGRTLCGSQVLSTARSDAAAVDHCVKTTSRWKRAER